jgi:hypothetical protein
MGFSGKTPLYIVQASKEFFPVGADPYDQVGRFLASCGFTAALRASMVFMRR